jgi:NADH-ubiquinone oxidoreductase chain 5
MYFSLFILSVGSVFSGFLLKDAFVGVGSKFWGNSIFIRDNNYSSLDYEFIPFFFKNLPLMFSFLGIIFGLCLNTIFLTTKTTRVELICIEETLYNKPVARKSLIKFI